MLIFVFYTTRRKKRFSARGFDILPQLKQWDSLLVEYILNAKGVTLQALSPITATSGERVLSIFVNLDSEFCGICPHYGRKGEYYDFPKKIGVPRERSWRSLDWGHTI